MKMSHNILVVEDDHAVNNLLVNNLVGLGYDVNSAFDGERGLEMALEKEYQIVLLDVMIPKLNGFEVLKKIRDTKRIPVLMLTAKGAEEDRICGFKTGADDYLIKPFSMAELELRIQAILRRTQNFDDAHNTHNKEVSSSMSIGFNKNNGEVMIKNILTPFTPIEFDLLYALFEEQGEILSKAHLYQNVLLREYSRYDRTLDMHISKIRKKLTAAGMEVNTIKTVRGQGYCYEE